jgi:Predicted transcriptional regulators
MRQLDLKYPTCPIRNILSRFSDKWSLLILCSLEACETMRYKDLNKNIPDISQKVLSGTLKRLVEDRLIVRKVYAEVPPRVEYSLTDMAREIMPAIQIMIGWAQQHFDEIVE